MRASVRTFDLRVTMVMAITIAAGCIAPTASPGPTGAALIGEIPSVALPGDSRVGEPTIVVAPDGHTLYVSGVAQVNHNTYQAENHAWRSDDGGVSWTYLGKVAPQYGSQDTSITARGDATVWAFTSWANDPTTGSGGEQCTAVSRSQDRGATWQTNPLGCIPTGIVASDANLVLYHADVAAFFVGDDRPWSAADGTTTAFLHVQYAYYPQGYSQTWVLSRTTDNSRWDSIPLPFTTSLPGSSAFAVAGPLSFRSNVMAFAYSNVTYPPSPAGIVVASSRDDGMSWTFAHVSSDLLTGRYPSVAQANGTAIAAWVTGTNYSTAPRVRIALEDGGSWSGATTIAGDGTNVMPWATALGDHRAVVWLHTDAEGDPANLPNGSAWYVRGWIDGRVVNSSEVVHRGGICAGFEDCNESHRWMGDFISGALMPDGSVKVALAKDVDPGSGRFASPLHVLTLR
ncbi:MAG: sialidase family protein [Thermoplasmatota archaeon]